MRSWWPGWRCCPARKYMTVRVGGNSQRKPASSGAASCRAGETAARSHIYAPPPRRA